MTTDRAVIDADTASADVPHRQCGWCTNEFPIVCRPGRPLIYCSRSCRQRAYERRRGLGVLPPPDRIIMQPSGLLGHVFPGLPQRPGYERAKITLVTGRPHALRPSGIVDRQRRRLTLCGLLASATPGRFEALEARACKTCARVASIRPPGRPVQVSEELAALRSAIDALGVELSRRLLEQQQSGTQPTEADRIFTELVLAA